MRTFLILIFSLVLFTSTATAQTYTDVGGSDDLSFSVYGDDSNDNPILIDGLSASLSYVLSTVDGGTTWLMAVTIENTSSISSSLTGFGFDFASASTIASVTVDDDNGVFSGVHVPGGFPNVLGDFVDLKDLDVCIDTDGGSCTGSGGGLTMSGEGVSSTTLLLTILLNAEVDEVTFGDFGIRYQGFTFDDPNGGTISSAVGVVGEVPEPSTWLMMIIGFGLVGAAARRSRRRTHSVLQTC